MDSIFYDLLRDGATPESLADAMNAALRRYEEDKERAAVEAEKAIAANALADAFNNYFAVVHPDFDWTKMSGAEAARCADMIVELDEMVNAFISAPLANLVFSKPAVKMATDPIEEFLREIGV
ncbi:MAG: hypothetical protein IKB70_08210 [Bacilli bacterium]|nr:hypothetical protein [Bacilli bacterium]